MGVPDRSLYSRLLLVVSLLLLLLCLYRAWTNVDFSFDAVDVYWPVQIARQHSEIQ